MLRGAAVLERALARGIITDHAADASARRGRELRGKEELMRSEQLIELVLDDARLNPD